MEVKHEQNGSKGVFFLEEQNQRIAELAYVFAGETKFIIKFHSYLFLLSI